MNDRIETSILHNALVVRTRIPDDPRFRELYPPNNFVAVDYVGLFLKSRLEAAGQVRTDPKPICNSTGLLNRSFHVFTVNDIPAASATLAQALAEASLLQWSGLYQIDDEDHVARRIYEAYGDPISLEQLRDEYAEAAKDRLDFRNHL